MSQMDLHVISNAVVDSAHCQLNVCLNGGSCHKTDNSYQCFCPDGIIGSNCESDLCRMDPCLNGATCIGIPGGYHCSCTEAFSGIYCQTKIKPAINGMWSDWDPWSTCSASCGGGLRTRTRPCADPAPHFGGLDCVGPATEIQKCSGWQCPDCSRFCEGSWVDCSLCMCDGVTITGLVIDMDTKIYLPDVNVFVIGREWEPIATTDDVGQFTLSGLCLNGLELKFELDRYISEKSKYAVASTTPHLETIQMQEQVKPMFSLHPEDQASFINNDVTFACSAIAIPPPHLYEWFKDGNILSLSDVNPPQSNVLTINSVTQTHAGQYSCRAVSQSGKTLSRAATLIVAEPDILDTCSDNPRPYIYSIPSGCYAEINGELTTALNIGKCRTDVCSTIDAPNQRGRCCGPVSTEPITITCPNFLESPVYEIETITTCGCIPCSENQNFIVSGTVFMLADGVLSFPSQPVRIDLGFNGDIISVSAAESWQFYFEVESMEDSITALVYPSNGPSGFFPKVEIIHLSKGSLLIEHNVFLDELPSPVAVDGSNGGTVNVQSPLGLSQAVIVTLPENSLVDRNGNMFTGPVNVYAKFYHPKDVSGISPTPGELSTIDEEGFNRPLQTFGITAVDFRDTVGNRLHLTRPIKLDVNVPDLNIPIKDGKPDANLWFMDLMTGKWIDQGGISFPNALRRKRQIIETASGKVNINDAPFVNCDRPWIRERLCQILVFVYNYDMKNTVSGIPVEAIVMSDDGYTLLGRLRATTDSDGKVCVMGACGLRHFIHVPSAIGAAYPNDEHHLPVGFDFLNVADQFVEFVAPVMTHADGSPVFRVSSNTCLQSTIQDYHFQFILEAPPQGQLIPVQRLPNRKLSWYQNVNEANTSDTYACFIKIGVNMSFWNSADVQLTATSRYDSESGPSYGIYSSGIHLNHLEVAKNTYNNFACLQVKCPGDVYDEVSDSFFPDVPTYVTVRLFYPNGTVCRARNSDMYRQDLVTGLFKVKESGTRVDFQIIRDDMSLIPAYRGSRRTVQASVLRRCFTSPAAAAFFDCQDTPDIDDECASGPCQNGGACSDGVDGYTCNCQNGYTGATCEIDLVK